MAPEKSSWLTAKKLLFITGKGGVGKTTVATALGLASASLGQRTIICEVGERHQVSDTFLHGGSPPDTETELAENLWSITIDPQAAMLDWFERHIGGGPVMRTLTGSSAFQYFVAAAPGARELITLGKIVELTRSERWNNKDQVYDLVIVDGPATGHALGMLATPATFGEIVKNGKIGEQTQLVKALLSDPEMTGYIGVTRAEEMPVNEILELEKSLEEKVGLNFEAVIVNGLYPPAFSPRERAELETTLPLHSDTSIRSAVEAALRQSDRATHQQSFIRRLKRSTTTHQINLPFVFEPQLGILNYEQFAEILKRDLGHEREFDDEPEFTRRNTKVGRKVKAGVK